MPRFFAVGDIHGCLTQLTGLLDQVEHLRTPDDPLIFIGDTIDRGPHSALVLTQIFEMAQSAPQTNILLMGNHEKMLLEFIDDPAGRGARWIANGGIQTLQSFGITDLPPNPDAEDAACASNAMVKR